MRLLAIVIPLVANTNSFKNKKQSECLVPLFEAHITLGFKSEVSAFIYILSYFQDEYT